MKLLKSDYWQRSSVSWEIKRYESLWSKLVFRSLLFRQRYAAWCVGQMPRGSTIVEVGCGTGRLYGKIKDRQNYRYFGFDISPEAIAEAKFRYKDDGNATWVVGSCEGIVGLNADLVVSAGLLDWITDEQIEMLHSKNSFKNFLHSFSLKQAGWKVKLHLLFAFLVSKKNLADYSPRKFSVDEIHKLFGSSHQIISHPELSFGAFIGSIDFIQERTYNNFKISEYFLKKSLKKNFIERFFKSKETSCLKDFIALTKNLKVLDVGSGDGHYSLLAINSGAASVVAIDPCAPQIKSLDAAKNFSYIAGRFETAKVNEKFDYVFALGILEFVNAPEDALEVLLKMASPKGTILILSPKNKGLVAILYKGFHRFFGRRITADVSTVLEKSLQSKKIEFTKLDCGYLNYLFKIIND